MVQAAEERAVKGERFGEAAAFPIGKPRNANDGNDAVQPSLVPRNDRVLGRPQRLPNLVPTSRPRVAVEPAQDLEMAGFAHATPASRAEDGRISDAVSSPSARQDRQQAPMATESHDISDREQDLGAREEISLGTASIPPLCGIA
jgi:hypothetical protein